MSKSIARILTAFLFINSPYVHLIYYLRLDLIVVAGQAQFKRCNFATFRYAKHSQQ